MVDMQWLRRVGASMIVGGALCWPQMEALSAPIYDAAADFSTSSDPNGVWTYGYSSSGGATYSLITFDQVRSTPNLTLAWGSSQLNNLGAPLAWVNISSFAINGNPPGEFALHPGPGPNQNYAILRFTAPSSGTYDITATFKTGDRGETDARVLLNADFANPEEFFASTTGNVTYSDALILGAGDFLDFVVGPGNDFFNDTTPLSVVITDRTTTPSTVPVPGTALLLALGIVGMRFTRRAPPSKAVA